MSNTYTYNFGAAGTITVTTQSTTTATANGTGYLITAISGTWQGNAIIGETDPSDAGTRETDINSHGYDNTVFTDDSQGFNNSTYGIDNYGIDFNTSAATYDLHSFSGGFIVGTSGANETPTLTSSNAPCYCPGTLIRTTHGDVAVEALAIGDMLVTAAGAARPIKWIGRRSYSGRFANNNPDLLPICVHAGALADGVPARDLWVSPKHALYLDGVLIPAEHLVNGVSIVKAARVDQVEYFHLELPSHDVILAEDTPAESFLDDDSRGLFQNAHEFAALYPDARPAGGYCAPRVEDGAVLAAVQRRIAVRAGLPIAAPRSLGALRGCVDQADTLSVQGWAQSEACPDAPVCLEVLVDGVTVGLVLAEDYRADLRRAGIGDGCHGFHFRFAAPLARTARRIDLRRAADGAGLATRLLGRDAVVRLAA